MISGIDELNKLNWVDTFLSNIQISSGHIRVTIDHEENGICNLLFIDYIAFEHYGHWDESIIESIQIDLKGELIEKALNEVKKNYTSPEMPFCNKRIDDDWIQINIKIVDDSVIKIVCKDIQLEKIKIN